MNSHHTYVRRHLYVLTFPVLKLKINFPYQHSMKIEKSDDVGKTDVHCVFSKSR